MTKNKTVWVLTSEGHYFDQQGKYFEGVFDGKPTLKQLAQHFARRGVRLSSEVMEVVAILEHILEGGGPQEDYSSWYNLKEVPFDNFNSTYDDVEETK